MTSKQMGGDANPPWDAEKANCNKRDIHTCAEVAGGDMIVPAEPYLWR